MVRPPPGLTRPATPFPYTTLFRALLNGALILRHRKVMAYTLALGFLFGALLLYVSIAPALFFDLYGIDDTFPLYFAIIALGLGIAAYFNSRLVVHYGMYRLSMVRSEEHTSELQSLMRISYAVFCLKKKQTTDTHITQPQ